MAKRLTFPPKTTQARKDAITATLWALQQQPTGGFESSNVTLDIAQYLAHAGYAIEQHLVRKYLEWLEERGFAIKSMEGRRHTLAMATDDAPIAEPAFVKAAQVKAQRTTAPQEPAPAAAHVNGAAVRRPPPLPRRANALPHDLLSKLTRALGAWWSEDPAACEAWMAEAIASLSDL